MSPAKVTLTIGVGLAVIMFMLFHVLFTDNPIVIKRHGQVREIPPTVSPAPGPVAEVEVPAPQPTRFTEAQTRLLRIAYQEGAQVGWPETIQAILLQETTAGVHGPVGDRGEGFGKRSYCHMQVKLAAAKDVLRHYPDVGSFATDEELLAELLTNDRFCIRVGAHYFKLMAENAKNWPQAVLAYNRGLTGARRGHDPMNYINGIRKKIYKWIRPHQNVLSFPDSGYQQVAMVGQ